MKTKRSSSSMVTDQDVSLYDGPDPVVIVSSTMTAIQDIADDLRVSLDQSEIKILQRYVEKFVSSFGKAIQGFRTGQEVKDFADRCKERRSDLMSVVNSCISSHGCLFPEEIFIINSRKDKVLSLENYQYIPDSFTSYCHMIKELGEVISFIELKEEPRFYIYLYRLFFRMCKSITCSEQEFVDNIEKYSLFLMIPVSLGQIFEHLNPTDDITDQYGTDLLNLLRQESKDPSPEFWSLFEAVRRDINKKNPPKYVRDVVKAINKVKRMTHKYCDHDYYTASKASNASVRDKDLNKGDNYFKLNSLYSSVIEYDPLLGDPMVQEFDNLIGYTSNYILESDLPDNLDMAFRSIITMMIPNPGKYKPRGIHVACNAIQDRCKYLHRIGKAFLKEIPSNCMDDHFRGVKFLLEVTNPKYRKENLNNVFVSDFTNATDTLNQEFQCKVIEVFFPDHPEYANFWKVLCKLPKAYRNPLTKQLEDYIQMTGQPQGLLFSFDAFTMAHLYSVLMLMKSFQLEGRSLSDTLAIVGDDADISYPAKFDQEENMNYLHLTFYAMHSWLCDEVSLIKNDSKTGKSFFNDLGSQVYNSELLTFAKVTVYEGRLMTPLPYGLLASYSEKPGVSDIQAILWMSSKGITFKTAMYKRLLQHYASKPNQLVSTLSLVSSGQIPLFKGFEDENLYRSIPSPISGCSLYYYYRNSIIRTFFGNLISDRFDSKYKTVDKFISDSIDLISEDFEKLNKLLPYIQDKLPKNHKYNILVNKNLEIVDNLSTIFSFRQDIDTVSVALSLFTDPIYEELFHHILWYDNLINQAIDEDSEDIWEYFCYQEFPEFKMIEDPIQDFQVKSMKKASSHSVRILSNAARASANTIKSSSCLQDELFESFENCFSNFMSILGDCEAA